MTRRGAYSNPTIRYKRTIRVDSDWPDALERRSRDFKARDLCGDETGPRNCGGGDRPAVSRCRYSFPTR